MDKIADSGVLFIGCARLEFVAGATRKTEGRKARTCQCFHLKGCCANPSLLDCGVGGSWRCSPRGLLVFAREVVVIP